MQKKAIRIITNSSYTAHTPPLFNNLGILQYSDLITQSQLTLMHAVHYKYAPVALLNTWTLNSDRQDRYELRNDDNYSLPRVNYSIIRRLPLYSLPLAWNNAPSAKYHANPTTFKIALKNALITQHHDQNPVLEQVPAPAPAPAPAPVPAPARIPSP